jgi:membrane fusion protein, multidrug efflux system
VILSGGVKPGDQIVVDGQEKLKNGSKVFAKQAPAKASVDVQSGTGQPS